MRHFAHHIGDYAAATAHLTFVEDAAYHRLLRLYYQNEKPLPVDELEVMRLVRAVSRYEKKAVSRILREFFSLSSDGWHQRRADHEISKYKHLVQAGVEGSRRSVLARGLKQNRTPGGTNQEPLTKNQEPRTNTLTPSAQARGSHSLFIDDEFQPSEADVTGLRKEIPWLVGELYDSRQRDFRDWCAANATRSFNPAATWRGFMRRTKQPRDNVETFDQRRIRECLKVINDC